MTVRQLSVFLENKPGRLCSATDILAREGINLNALTVADTAEFGILRLIVDQPDRAREVLMNEGIVVRISEVLAIAMDDAPGGAVGILHLLSEAGLNIEYMYACVGKQTGKAIMIVRTDDIDLAEQILRRGGYGEINPADVYRL
ncbi:MAG: hypothetical protein E7625_04680 [Ruminococcaceae bacterium]|nr:hypothetical protein [Oscillospiraceae bacterium]